MGNGNGLWIALAGMVLAAGLAAAGGLIGKGFVEGRMADRYVTVKGLAEREVQADLAVWPLGVTAAGDDLAAVQASVETDLDKVAAFLTDQGIEPASIEHRRPNVTDMEAREYGNTGQAPRNRYIVRQQIVVRGDQVELVQKLAGDLGSLVRQGVVLSDNQGPFFTFTRLNEIKPEMIAEATRAARAGAEQFAADSNATVGGIRRARQGLFSIQARDGAESYDQRLEPVKKVRVVSTIDFYLTD
ncbi:hypothetical protein CCR85_03565 [Rhodothalassium salexigens]|uniref:SIMPL domain-containing protein n=1 Tax=Rhodothalassium salexigens TaxID=1086 RepID=UPI001912E1D2|nr:SIMPL domain-containing protein [Rhodothalassium salexigens]MBK5910569.1 hypothetical protein [Rhodothalassium salexigens]MBK5920306.1 hypothetical protein [Rhodothalassium salexigens]